MNSPIQKLVYESENRYLGAAECSAISRYASSVPLRLAVASEVEKIESAALRDFMGRVEKKYPEIRQYHEESTGIGEHDCALTVRVMVHSMVLDDMSHLDERLLHWLRTVQASFGLTPGFIRDFYTCLKQAFVERLSMESAKTMAPYFDHVIEGLSDSPTPATNRP